MIILWWFLSASTSWLLGFYVNRLLLRIKLYDQPNARSSHSAPTVRGGGIGIVIIVIALGVAAGLESKSPYGLEWLSILGFLAIISFIDDLRSLSWKIRFGAHIIAAVSFIYLLIGRGYFSGMHPLVAFGISTLVGLFLIGYTNAYNFMDGINGIAAGQAAITGMGSILIAFVTSGYNGGGALIGATLVSGAAAGFLPHNFPRSKMFMGDVGSVFLGFALASIAVVTAAVNSWWLLIPFGLLHANYILDTGLTVIRRIRRGESFHEAHREHFYQRLVRAGRSHVAVTLIELGLQVIVVCLLLIYTRSGIIGKCLSSGLILLIWALFFAWAESSFRGASKALR
jgi:UDP-N-acetylmuramyl pentapeptide phosphotransferase/UDP-N-acetylglucosamine-1-phosphate transferase